MKEQAEGKGPAWLRYGKGAQRVLSWLEKLVNNKKLGTKLILGTK